MRRSSLENPCNEMGRASQDRIPSFPIDREIYDLARTCGTILPTTCLLETRTRLPIVMCSTSLEVERRHLLATTVQGHKSTRRSTKSPASHGARSWNHISSPLHSLLLSRHCELPSAAIAANKKYMRRNRHRHPHKGFPSSPHGYFEPSNFTMPNDEVLFSNPQFTTLTSTHDARVAMHSSNKSMGRVLHSLLKNEFHAVRRHAEGRHRGIR